MIRIILIVSIIIICFKIYEKRENFINITNPYVSGLSQFQLGDNRPDNNQILNSNDYQTYDDNLTFDAYSDQYNNQLEIDYNDYIAKSNNTLSTKNKLNGQFKPSGPSKPSRQFRPSKPNRPSKPRGQSRQSRQKCKELNKFFIESQFNDSYRDTLTAINIISPDQKIMFNIQSLPVTSVKYDGNKPIQIQKLVDQFIKKLNSSVNKLPESVSILNTTNNYLPATASLHKYSKDRGINKFYNDIGVDYNLYVDTPPNSMVELIQIISAQREFTEAETKYIISIVIKKEIESVTDQLKLTIHFIIKNDPLEGDNLFMKTVNPQLSQQVAIEFIFIDGFYTNDFNVNYDCYENNAGNGNINKLKSSDDNFYSFEELGKETIMSDHEVIKELNKKNKLHQLEMANFNVNIPYPVYQNPANKSPPAFI